MTFMPSVSLYYCVMHKTLSSLTDEGKIEVNVVMDEGNLFTGGLDLYCLIIQHLYIPSVNQQKPNFQELI